jgi:hypothetical protein
MRLSALLVVGCVAMAGVCAASGAHAETRCEGPAVQAGQSVHGPILNVIDDKTVCVALAGSPTTWVPVILATPATTRSRLMAAAFGKNATCVIDAQGRGDCVVEGEKLAEVLQRPEIVRASLEWR